MTTATATKTTTSTTSKTPSVKNEIDWSLDTTFEILTAEFRKLSAEGKLRGGLLPSHQWLADCFDRQFNRFGRALGPTLRRSIPVAAATGNALRDQLIRTWTSHEYYIPFPDSVTGAHLDNGEYTEYKRGKTGAIQYDASGNPIIVKKKLTRYLADYCKKWLTTQDPAKLAEEKEFPAAFVSQVMDDVNRANGAYMTYSAHPLCILYSSDYATYTSCHQWATIAGKETQPHSSANFCYLSGPPQTTIAYLWKPTRTRQVAGNPAYIIPEKHYRQYVFCPIDRPLVAWFGRHFPGTIGEPQHLALRRMVAETLTGIPTEEGSEPKWRYQYQGDSKYGPQPIYTKFASGYAYSDPHTAFLDASPERTARTGRATELATVTSNYGDKYKSHTVPAAICPCCLAERDDGQFAKIVCDDCAGKSMRCAHDRKHYDLDETGLRDWLNIGGGQWVHPSNAHHYALCDHTQTYYAKKYMHSVVTRMDPAPVGTWVHRDYFNASNYWQGRSGTYYRMRLKSHPALAYEL